MTRIRHAVPRALCGVAIASVASLAVSCAPAAQTAAPETANAPAAAPAPAAAEAPAPVYVSHAAPGPKADAQKVTITLADSGLEADSLDKSVQPCDDFYKFACGNWIAKHPIPADRARWSRFAEADERNENALRQILEDARAGQKGESPVMKKLGSLYGSCMDEASVEKAGITAIKPLLAKADKVKDAKSLYQALLALHLVNIEVLFSRDTEADFTDSTMNVLFLDSGGLGLPDRDYYLVDGLKEKRDAYKAHLVRVFGLLGKDAAAAEAAANDVMAVETSLAKVTRTAAERRDIPKMYNPVDMDGLKKLVPSIPWDEYLKSVGITPQKKIVVTTPEFFAGVEELIKTTPATQWVNYLTLRIVDGTAESLPKKFDDELFSLNQAISGVEKQRDRYKRCIDAVAAGMPEYLGQPYVQRMFPGDSKKIAQDLVSAIGNAMGADFTQLDWMSDQTKNAAKSKLSKIVPMIGFPDAWKTYDFQVDPKHYAANMLAARAFETKRQMVKAGKPYDRSEWLMGAFEVNAYYNPLANNTALPAGILQPPFFGATRSVAANLGGIGMVIGHELTHGFDDQGAQFDEQGNMRNWWQEKDLGSFSAKGQCVARQYGDVEILPGRKINGQLTLGENIADMGGVKMAFNAYRTLRNGADKTFVADGFNEDQQFFLAVAQAWCSQSREAESIRLLTIDPHSPPPARVFGSLRNLPEFANAFSCKAGQRMSPTQSCQVW
jgi:putative endopeptidase